MNQVCYQPLVSTRPFMYLQSPDVEDVLVARFDRVLDQLLHNQEVAERRQENTEAQLAFLVDELRRLSKAAPGGRSRVGPIPPSPDHADNLMWNNVPRRKDSAGNYLRVCH